MNLDPALERAGAYDGYKKWVRHNMIAGAITVALALVFFHLIWPIHVLTSVPEISFSARLGHVGGYFVDLFKALTFQIPYTGFVKGYYLEWLKKMFAGEMALSIAWVFWLAVVVVSAVTGIALNKHDKTPNIYGDTRWATRQDIESMEGRNLVGFKTSLFVVGRFDGDLIRMGETLSILLLAPPGCQPAGSKVRLHDGSFRNIEDIRVGDRVLSPAENGDAVAVAVTRLLHYEDRPLYKVAAEGVAYRCADNHLVTSVRIGATAHVWTDLPAVDLAADPANLAQSRLPVQRNGAQYFLPFTLTRDGRGDVYGFELAEGNQRYYTDHDVVTHNTGKSVGFIVPSAVSMDRTCLFFHDQKPELFDMTSGHRAKVGPVFQLKWSAQDQPNGTWLSEEQAKLTSPDLLERDEQNQPIQDETGRYKTRPIFYPSWNPISPKSIPGIGPGRDMYIERLVNVLCPDPTGGDKFWTEKARVALIGLIHFLIAKVEYALDPLFQGSWKGVPEHWHGREASFPMLVDWFTRAQMDYDDGSDDPMKALFKALIEEANAMDKEFAKRYGNRVLNRSVIELTNLMNSPDKTRGSILQTMDGALGPFKNEAVRQRTAYSDFGLFDLRGMPTPEAKAREDEKVQAALNEGKIYKPRYKKNEYLPVSVYISVSAEDAKAFANITGIFVDATNAYLVANGPNAIDDQNNQLGPFDFCYMLDESPQLPKLDTVINGPAVGRSKRISYIIVGQDFGQFEQKYSKPEVETLKSTTAIKIVLSQNNENAAEQVAKMAGKMTYISENSSEKQGDPKNPFSFLFKGKSKSWSVQQTEFLKASFISSMPLDKHVVMVQNYMNRPILCDTPKFFLDKEMRPKVYNLRTSAAGDIDFTGTKYGPAPTRPMPEAFMEQAAERYTLSRQTTADMEQKQEALAHPRHLLIATPHDIQSLSRDEYSEKGPLGKTYAYAEVFINPTEGYLMAPDMETVKITTSLEDIVEAVGPNRFIIFNMEQFQIINDALRAEGKTPLDEEFAVFVANRANDVGEESSNDIYALGYQGSPGLDMPESPDQATPQFTVRFIAEIMSFILGIEDQKRLFDTET